MLRLRTTTSLSTLALLIGVAGTGWISSLTPQWREPPDQLAMVGSRHATLRSPPQAQRRHGPVTVVAARRAGRPEVLRDQTVHAAVSAPLATLQPLTTPADTSQRWGELRGHLDGQVLVWLRVDGAGRVEDASVITSSGDTVLDQHALRSVRAWRFAVPADRPDGLSGELPMRFSSKQGRQLGML
jgi:protein TonB